MRALLSLVGLAICGAAVVAFCYAIYSMGHIGTCASGGPYVSARPCPAGTGLKIALIPIAVFGGLLGVLVYNAGIRWKRSSPIGLGVLMWSFTFLGSAGSLAYAAWGPAASPDAGNGVQFAAIVLLVIFIPMGLFPLVGALLGRGGRSSRLDTPAIRMTPAAAPIAPRPTSPGASSTGATAAALRSGLAMSGGAPPADFVARLERLDGLRKTGAITDEEFDRLKARLLSGG